MPLKTYETIGVLNRYTHANIDGREIAISFINGTEAPRKIQGRFTTKDPKIQQWIETSGNFNVKYRLVSSVPIAEDKKVIIDPDDDKAKVVTPVGVAVHDDLAMSVPEETDEDITPEEVFTEPEITEPPDFNVPVIVGDEVVNGQQARNYLMEHFKDLTFRQVGNNAQIIAEAKAHNVQFTAWEAFVTTK